MAAKNTVKHDILRVATRLALATQAGDTKRNAAIFARRYGAGGEMETLAAIGAEHGLSRARVHKLIQQMVAKKDILEVGDARAWRPLWSETQTSKEMLPILGGVSLQAANRFYADLFDMPLFDPEIDRCANLSEAQFSALSELIGGKVGVSTGAAKLVLVDGMTPAAAAAAVGTTPQNVNGALSKYRRACKLARVFVGA